MLMYPSSTPVLGSVYALTRLSSFMSIYPRFEVQDRISAPLWTLCRSISTNNDSHWSRDSVRPAWGSDWTCGGFHAVCAAIVMMT